MLNVPHETQRCSTVESKILRLLVYAHPGSLNANYLRHRLNLKEPPLQEAKALAERGLIEPVPPVRDPDAPEWRATRAGIWHDEHGAVHAERIG